MVMAQATRYEDARIDASVFEAVYDRGLVPDAALRQKLAAAGYDPQRRSAAYPPEVMDCCLDVAALHLYPDLPSPEALRAIGHCFAQGTMKTLAGAAIAAVFPLIGPDQVLARIARSWHVGQNFGRATLFPIDRGSYRFEYRNGIAGINSNVSFAVGVFESLLELTKTRARIASRLVEDGFDLEILWDWRASRTPNTRESAYATPG
jgi:uncharacterized protein (TIGR02265 family)